MLDGSTRNGKFQTKMDSNHAQNRLRFRAKRGVLRHPLHKGEEVMPRAPFFKSVKFIKVPWLKGKGERLVQSEKRTRYGDNDFFGSLIEEMRFRRKK